MPSKKKTPPPATIDKGKVGTEWLADKVFPYLIETTTDGKRWSATIFRQSFAGPHQEVIRKNNFRDKEEAEAWGRYHCEMRDYRPFTTGQVV